MNLEEIKDKLANEHYRTPFWMLLTEHQQAMLADDVAIEYALQEVNKLGNTFIKSLNA